MEEAISQPIASCVIRGEGWELQRLDPMEGQEGKISCGAAPPTDGLVRAAALSRDAEQPKAQRIQVASGCVRDEIRTIDAGGSLEHLLDRIDPASHLDRMDLNWLR